jgi:tetratricopeptide (TPR) repeat protein
LAHRARFGSVVVVAPSPQPRAESNSSRWGALALVAAVGLVYANSLHAPFVFDDLLSITENPTIRRLWPLTEPLSPPSGQGLTVEGRPLLNLSLALNYAVSGTAPRSYHLTNIAIHALATLTLFGLVHRTLVTLHGQSAPLLAFSAALLWAVHPLQTESVTYVVQRTESLMGLFLLATLYCFRRGWLTAAFIACLLGMATKEVMVVAPLLVVLYDRTFVSGSFRAGWQRHRAFYGALAATWLLLGALVLGAGNRGGTIGSSAGVSPWDYALCQSRAVLHYARLALWPHPLVFDYGPDFVSFATAAPYLLLVLALVTATGFALWRRPALGFLGAWYFLILAPTSSVVGGTRQMLAEHRIYLSLAALAVLATLLAHRWLGRRCLWAVLPAALALGAATAARNTDYATTLTLYRDTAVKRPANGFARYNLAQAYADAGRHAEAIPEFEAALDLLTSTAPVHNNLGNSLVALGRLTEAKAHFEAALQRDPRYAKAHFNLGNLLLAAGDEPGAVGHFRSAVALDSAAPEARTNLAGALLELGQLDAARTEFEEVLRARPDSVEARFGLGTVHLLQNRSADAVREFEAVLRLRPDLAAARERLELARRRP